MKKLILFSIIFIMAMTNRAQRCAVLDFQIGTGVTEEDIDGISYNFRANFVIKDFTMLERNRINSIVDTLGYNRTDMTMQQMLKVGRELEAKLVVIGTMNKFMDEYSVDIRVIDVATGITHATEGAIFTKTNYRTTMESLADKLSKKVSSGSSPSSTSYATSANKAVQQGYTDLGLPSGTIWKNFNSTGHYTYEEAISKFGNRLPTKEQWDELRDECQWTWTGSGYKVTGPNGKSITIPADGDIDCSGIIEEVGVLGSYWSSTPGDTDRAWRLGFDYKQILLHDKYRCYGRSIRLIQN